MEYNFLKALVFFTIATIFIFSAVLFSTLIGNQLKSHEIQPIDRVTLLCNSLVKDNTCSQSYDDLLQSCFLYLSKATTK